MCTTQGSYPHSHKFCRRPAVDAAPPLDSHAKSSVVGRERSDGAEKKSSSTQPPAPSTASAPLGTTTVYPGSPLGSALQRTDDDYRRQHTSQSRFDKLSDTIVNRIDEMGSKIDECVMQEVFNNRSLWVYEALHTMKTTPTKTKIPNASASYSSSSLPVPSALALLLLLQKGGLLLCLVLMKPRGNSERNTRSLSSGVQAGGGSGVECGAGAAETAVRLNKHYRYPNLPQHGGTRIEHIADAELRSLLHGNKPADVRALPYHYLQNMVISNAIQSSNVLEGMQVHASLRRPDEGVRDGMVQNHDVMQMSGPDAAPSHPRDERAQTLKQGDISANSRPTSGKDSGKILNSEIYQPDTTTGRRLVTYKRYGGRLFVGALQHAKVLKRTLVVPDEKSDFEWTGMFDTYFDIWDLSSLNENYDIDWSTGLDGSLTDVKMQATGCLLSLPASQTLLEKGPSEWIKLDKKCPDAIHLNYNMFTCNQQHQYCGDKEAQMEAYNIYSHLKLSPSLMQYIPSKRPQFTGLGYDEMAIHSRRAGEGMYKWEICIEGTRKTCMSHMKVGSESGNKFCDERTLKGNCAIWADLNYQIKSRRFFKPNLKDYKFVLASDGTHDWDLDFKGQYIAANNSEWLRDFGARFQTEMESGKFSEQPLADAIGVSGYIKKERIVWGTVDALSATLLDLFSLVDSKYLLGAYYSTLSLNACYLRGLDRIYDSNMCWMLIHPGHPEPVIPSADDLVNIYDNKEEKSEIPPALVNDVEHAFVRSGDGDFIAIDRYLIHGDTKSTVAVLGDGLVPLSFVKGVNGKESVYTNVTCSSSGGKQQDTPATIVLMGGHRLF
ncbi:hypothetical protein THAOC_20255, partial [Thalassiosira oceanica]